MVAVLDETESDVERIIARDFGPGVLGPIDHRFIDWLHFKARCIPRRTRAVFLSDEVRGELAAYPAISRIVSALRSGEDVRAWLSDRVRLRKSDGRADVLFNAWQLSHFHLSSVFVKADKAGRTGPLLFAYIALSEAVLLKVGDHATFSDRELCEILLRTYPAALEQYELKGILPPRSEPEKDFRTAHRGGVNAFVTIAGRVFMPGLGVSTSRHATRLVRTSHRVQRVIRNVRESLVANRHPPETARQLLASIGRPVVIGLTWHEEAGLIIHDKNRPLTFHIEPPPS